jgi:hypothetical protein
MPKFDKEARFRKQAPDEPVQEMPDNQFGTNQLQASING